MKSYLLLNSDGQPQGIVTQNVAVAVAARHEENTLFALEVVDAKIIKRINAKPNQGKVEKKPEATKGALKK